MNTVNPFQQYFDDSGKLIKGGKIYSYVAESSIPKALYSDSDLTIPLTNPVELTASSRSHIFYGLGFYRLVLTDENDIQIDELDNVEVQTTGGGGTGNVESVFGRTGNVEAKTGDYTYDMVGAEAYLNTPNDNNALLVSTTTGTRSWIAPGDLNSGFSSIKVTGLLGKSLPTLDGNAFLKYQDSNWSWDTSTYQTKANNLDALSSAQGNGYFRRVNNVWTMDPNNYLTSNQSINVYGDVTGSGASNILTTVTGIRGVSVPALTSGKLTYTGGANTFSWTPTVSSAGVTGSSPNFNRSTDTITVNAFEVNIYTNSAFLGEPVKLHVPQSVITNIPRDGNTKFIAVNYNGGFPFSYMESVKSNINSSDIVAIASIWNIDGTIHLTDIGLSGDGLSNKLQFQSLQTQPYQRSIDGGLALSEDGARHIVVTSSTVYVGGTSIAVPGYGSTNYNHKLTMVYHSAGTWLYSTVNTGGIYNNSQIDNGTDLVSMGVGKYSVRWMYRSIGDDTQVFYILGSQQYNSVAQAQAEGTRIVPDIIRDHCMLVGRIIIQNNASSGLVESAFTVSFGASAIQDHAQLSNLNSSSYYHLTNTQYTDLTDGNDSTLHYHSADRNRSNHSGTQLASTISDFSTQVNTLISIAIISGGSW